MSQLLPGAGFMLLRVRADGRSSPWPTIPSVHWSTYNKPLMLYFKLTACFYKGPVSTFMGFQDGAVVKKLPANADDARDMGSIPRLGRSPGEGNDNPLQHSCQENSMDRGVWWATVHEVTKSWIWLNTAQQARVQLSCFCKFSRSQEHKIVLCFVFLCYQILLKINIEGIPCWSSV